VLYERCLLPRSNLKVVVDGFTHADLHLSSIAAARKLDEGTMRAAVLTSSRQGATCFVLSGSDQFVSKDQPKQ